MARQIRSDSTIRSAAKKLGIPENAFRNSNGRKTRNDKLIGTVRKEKIIKSPRQSGSLNTGVISSIASSASLSGNLSQCADKLETSIACPVKAIIPPARAITKPPNVIKFSNIVVS